MSLFVTVVSSALLFASPDAGAVASDAGVKLAQAPVIADESACIAHGGRWTHLPTQTGCTVRAQREGRWVMNRAGGQPLERSTWEHGARNGPTARYHDNCQVSEKGEYFRGKLEGHWEYFSKDGKKQREGTYAAGRLAGVWSFYDPDTGQKTLEGPYVDGVEHGTFTEWFSTGVHWREAEFNRGDRVGAGPQACREREGEWFVDYQSRKEGCLVAQREEGVWFTYDGHGALRSKGTYQAGVLNGLVEDFHPTGELLRRGQYLGGIPDGVHEFLAVDGTKLGVSTLVNGTGRWKSWHPNGKLFEDGTYEAGCPTGLFRTFNEEGRPMVEEHYVDCTRHGAAVRYHANGAKRMAGTYEHGRAEGEWSAWYNNGDPEWTGTYQSGARVGAWKLYRWGKKLESEGQMEDNAAQGPWTHYGPTGEVQQTGSYVSNQKAGPWKAYWTTGEPWRDLTYEGGREISAPSLDCARVGGNWFADPEKRALGCLVCRVKPDDSITQVGIGEWKYWHPSGELEKQGTLVEGKPDGVWHFFHDNGQPMLTGSFQQGVEEGPWRGAYRSGKPRFEGAYTHGKPDGEWTSFHPDGSLMSVGRYVNGEKRGPWRYEKNGKVEVVDGASGAAIK